MLIAKIEKPERFNSAELSALILANLGWKEPSESARMLLLDAVQSSLDGMVAKGILSEGQPGALQDRLEIVCAQRDGYERQARQWQGTAMQLEQTLRAVLAVFPVYMDARLSEMARLAIKPVRESMEKEVAA